MTHQACIGIDLGSRTTKIVLFENQTVAYTEVYATGHDPVTPIRETLSRLPKAPIMATGYGRHLLKNALDASVVTEITACAAGAVRLFPEVRVILDVGGQDCKAIRLDDHGRVADFEMNDRCAAGTGRFVEVMAQIIGMPLDEFVQAADRSAEQIPISSMCTVFAESEVVSLITSGKPREQIARGLHAAIADRLRSMLARMGEAGPTLFAGGGAFNGCLRAILEEKTGRKFIVPENPQTVTALGAALILSGRGTERTIP